MSNKIWVAASVSADNSGSYPTVGGTAFFALYFRVSDGKVWNEVEGYWEVYGTFTDIPDYAVIGTRLTSQQNEFICGYVEIPSSFAAGYYMYTALPYYDAYDPAWNYPILRQGEIYWDGTNWYDAQLYRLVNPLDGKLDTIDADLATAQADLDNHDQYKADVSALALEATLTAIKGGEWTTETLKAIKDAIDVVDGVADDILTDTNELQTDNIPGLISALNDPTTGDIADAVWDEAIADHTTATTFGGKNQKVVPSETINDYKADVSALALEATVAALNDISVSDILDGVIEGAYTLQDVLKIMAGVLAGKVSGGGSAQIVFRDLSDTLDRLTAVVDESGNRTTVTPNVN